MLGELHVDRLSRMMETHTHRVLSSQQDWQTLPDAIRKNFTKVLASMINYEIAYKTCYQRRVGKAFSIQRTTWENNVVWKFRWHDQWVYKMSEKHMSQG